MKGVNTLLSMRDITFSLSFKKPFFYELYNFYGELFFGEGIKI